MRLWPVRTLNTRIVQPAKDATHEDQPHASILTKGRASPKCRACPVPSLQSMIATVMLGAMYGPPASMHQLLSMGAPA